MISTEAVAREAAKDALIEELRAEVARLQALVRDLERRGNLEEKK